MPKLGYLLYINCKNIFKHNSISRMDQNHKTGQGARPKIKGSSTSSSSSSNNSSPSTKNKNSHINPQVKAAA